jgi:choline dehydrogenase
VNNQYDFIIVGAGAAGCILARGLAESINGEVLLLEAGGDGNEPRFIESGIENLFQSWFTESDWQLKTTPQVGLDNREVLINQGKVLGGGTAINAMMYLRGSRHNFQEWYEISGRDESWSPDHFQNMFLELESCLGNYGEDSLRGKSGRIKISQPPHPSASASAFLEGCQSLGYQRGDFNGSDQNERCDYMQLIIDHQAKRSSTANAFLRGDDLPSNLTIRCNTDVESLMIENGKCVGVCLNSGENLLGENVVLSAGALQSPALLMKSGIGPKAELEAAGISCQVNSPMVGKNLTDHMRVMLAYRSTTNPGVTNFLCEAALFTRSELNEGPETDLQINFSAGVDGFVAEEFIPDGGLEHSVIFVPVLGRPRSRGSVSPKPISDNEGIIFEINPGYLEDAKDLEVYMQALETSRQIANSEAMKPYCGEELCPGKHFDDAAYLRKYATTIWHPVGTCAIGSSENNVCRPDFSVRGVENLSVVDGSVLPTITSGNPQGAIFAVALSAVKRLSS